MKYQKALFSLFALLNSALLFGQSPTTVEGKVIDKKTRAPLDYANVRFKGILTGVHTDSVGNFKITTTTKVKTLVGSYLGYQTTEVPIQYGVSNKNIVIELRPLDIDLKEVVVKPGKKKKHREIDTTAMYVWHKVVIHKDENRPTNINNYYYKEYSKLDYDVLNPSQKFLNNSFFKPYKYFFEKPDTTADGRTIIPLFLQEDYLETWFRKKPRHKVSVVHYRKISGLRNPIFVKLIGYHFTVTDAYENVHIVFEKSFISPFAPTGNGVYNYHILDTAKIDGRTSYKLNFAGKVKDDLCTFGYAWIDSATWGIKSISYRPSEKANLNYIYNLLEEQSFELVDGTHWLMTKEHQVVDGNILKDPAKTSIRFEKNLVRKDIKIGVTCPDSIMKSRDDIIDPGAYKKRKLSYIDSMRLDSLTPSEKLVYHHFDTLQTTPVYRALDMFLTAVTQTNIRVGPVDFGRFYRIISRNNVEGWRLRMGVYSNPNFDDRTFIGAYAAYGTNDKRWKYSLNFRYLLPSKYDRWHAIEFEYKNDMLVLGNENPLLTYDNIATLLSGLTLSKIMRTREFNIYYERDWIKGLSSNITFTDRTFYAVPPVFYFYNAQLQGISSFNTTELTATLRYCKTDYYYEYYTYRYANQTKTPSIELDYTLGLKNQLFGGDYTYHKLSALFIYRWQMGELGLSKLRIRAGYIFGNSPIPVSYVAPSDNSIVRDDLSFQNTAPFQFVYDKFVMVWWEHYFGGFFLNRIPGVNKLHLREFIQCKTLWGGYSQHNASLMGLSSNNIAPTSNSLSTSGFTTPGPVPYVEVGAGIENILKIFQLGFFWHATYRDQSGQGAYDFVIRLGIYPSL